MAVEVAVLTKIHLGATSLPQQFNEVIVANLLSHTICHGILHLIDQISDLSNHLVRDPKTASGASHPTVQQQERL
jgi:hypothetical protein